MTTYHRTRGTLTGRAAVTHELGARLAGMVAERRAAAAHRRGRFVVTKHVNGATTVVAAARMRRAGAETVMAEHVAMEAAVLRKHAVTGERVVVGTTGTHEAVVLMGGTGRTLRVTLFALRRA